MTNKKPHIFSYALNAFISVVSLAYPLALFFAPSFLQIIAFSMAILWGVRMLIEKEKHKKIFAFCLMGLFGFIGALKHYLLAFMYPVIISVGLFVVFFLSLYNEPIITKFARLKHTYLSPNVLIYTRNVTKIWCVFFMCNALISLILATLKDKAFWAYYCGIVSYMIIGLLIVGEMFYRFMILHPKDR